MPSAYSGNDKVTSIPRDKKAGKRIRSFLLVVSVICLSYLFVTFIGYQYSTLLSVERKIAGISKDIEEQAARSAELERQKNLNGSSEYYEKVAREVLGLVYKNDIIFKKR